MKKISTLAGIIIIIIAAVVLFGGIFTYQYYSVKSETQNLRLETSTSVQNSSLPTKVGQCTETAVLRIETRLIDGSNGQPVVGSGSAVEYTNSGYQVSYNSIQGIENSRVGDKINLCLVSIPENCPPGDERGKIYNATNLRTNESWTLPDSSHFCGGA